MASVVSGRAAMTGTSGRASRIQHFRGASGVLAAVTRLLTSGALLGATACSMCLQGGPFGTPSLEDKIERCRQKHDRKLCKEALADAKAATENCGRCPRYCAITGRNLDEAEKANKQVFVIECQAEQKRDACYTLGDMASRTTGSFGIISDEAAMWFKEACKLGEPAACRIIESNEKNIQRAEQAEARAVEDAKARTEARRSDWTKKSAGGAKRSLQNPDDVQALQAAAKDFTRCNLDCARDVQSCINGSPGASQGQQAAQVCNPTYQTCQNNCEAALNGEGFCVEKNIVTGKPTGAVGPCP